MCSTRVSRKEDQSVTSLSQHTNTLDVGAEGICGIVVTAGSGRTEIGPEVGSLSKTELDAGGISEVEVDLCCSRKAQPAASSNMEVLDEPAVSPESHASQHVGAETPQDRVRLPLAADSPFSPKAREHPRPSTLTPTRARLHAAVERGDLDELRGAVGGPGWWELPEGEQEYIQREADHLQHKARRAALEALVAAQRSGDLPRLRRAIATAQRRDVPEDELEIAEAAAERLEIAEREEREGFHLRNFRDEAFEAIAADDPHAFEIAVQGHPWEGWKDDAGRDLLCAAHGEKASKVLELLQGGTATEKDEREAFRLVVQDDAQKLQQHLRACKVSPLVWAAWRNRGGKTLLQLAEERERNNVYTWMVLAAGRVQFLAPEKVLPGDAVWVFTPGCLQPRQAAVVGPADEMRPNAYDAELHVEVAFWDEEGDATHFVEPTRIRKMKS